MRNFVLILVSLTLALLAAEALTRAFYEPKSNKITAIRLQGSKFYQRDDELGWIPKANINGRHDKPGSFESKFSTNSHGFRDLDHSLSKDEGIQRIVVVGDSFAWGYGVNNGEIFTDYLEAGLKDTEVINLGVTGYGLWQETAIFKRIGLKFEPDVLLLAFVLNDIYRRRHAAADDTEPKGTRASDVGRGGGLIGKVKNTLSVNSALYSLFQDTTNQFKFLVDLLVSVGLKEAPGGFRHLDTNLMPALKIYPPALEKSWQDTKKDLLKLKSISEKNGVRFVVAVVPSLQSVNRKSFRQSIAYTTYFESDFDLDQPYRILEEFGHKHGIVVINAIDAFRRTAATGVDLYLRRDMHFSRDGHKLFAKRIQEYFTNLSKSGD